MRVVFLQNYLASRIVKIARLLRYFSRELRSVTKSPRRFLNIIGLPLMCMAMFSVVGGHWAILQAVAWTQMLHEYSKDSTITEAISKTFDGQHPCGLCCKVKEGRQREDKAPATVKVDKKAEVFTASIKELLREPSAQNFSYPRLTDLAFSGRTDAPPRPVPRFFIS